MAMRAPLRAFRSTSFCEYNLISPLLAGLAAVCARIKNPAAAVKPVRGLGLLLRSCLTFLSGVRACPAPLTPAKEQQRRQYQQQRRARGAWRCAGCGRCCVGCHGCEASLITRWEHKDHKLVNERYSHPPAGD